MQRFVGMSGMRLWVAVVMCLGLSLGCADTGTEQELSSRRDAVEVTSGPIFLTGHDPDFHAQDDAGAKRLLTKAVTYVRGSSSLPMLWVESRIATPAGHRIGKNGLKAIGMVEGTHFIHMNAAELAAQPASWWQSLSTRFGSIGVASDFGALLTQAELDQLNAHKDDISTFVNSGGGLMALSESGGGAGLTQHDRFKFLPIEVASTGNASPPYTVTSYGQTEFGLLDSDVNSPSHSHFNDAFGLNVVTRSAPTGQIMTLAGKVRITSTGFLVANAGPDQTLDATAALTPVQLNGSGSSTDAAGAPLHFQWLEGTTVLADTASATTTVQLAPGVHSITLVVSNSRNETASDGVVITLRNTLPPTITCPQNIVTNTDPSVCSTHVSYPDPVVSAPRGVASLACDPASGSSFLGGVTPVTCTVVDQVGNQASCSFTVTVKDVEPPVLTLSATESEVDGTCQGSVPDLTAADIALDNCTHDHDLVFVQTPPAGTAVGPGTHVITVQVTDESGNSTTASTQYTVIDLTPPNGTCGACFSVRLADYNLFLLGNYSQGSDIQGKAAAGGNITLNNFAVGSGLPASDIANTLVAGGNLTLSNGGVWGDAWYGGSYSAGSSVTFPRGSAAQGTPIDFTLEGARLRLLSARLASLPANGTTTRESWGGIMLRGSSPSLNVFQVPASAFTGATLLYIEAPAGSLAVLNISGASATFTGFGPSFAGGIDQHGVLYNFVDATSINANGFGFWGTVLAPHADVLFTNGSFDGGLYAHSLTGNAEGHINSLRDRDICQ